MAKEQLTATAVYTCTHAYGRLIMSTLGNTEYRQPLFESLADSTKSLEGSAKVFFKDGVDGITILQLI